MSVCLCAVILSSCELLEGYNDYYYIKYEAYNIYVLHNTTINTEKGTQTIDIKKTTFSEIYGPVSKGFQTSIQVQRAQSSNPATVQIYVSKNNGPFTLKASGNNSTSYTIDF